VLIEETNDAILTIYKSEETNQPPTLEHMTRMQLTRKFPDVAGGGECELRQVFTASDAAPTHAVETHAQLVEQMVKG
jgi:hypothetical protein